ncbi:hypothetical protein B484DRAFT_30638, partial [Ochromonadaceae sp. CCMP2298]
ENDLQLLANRIALLRVEEQRALQRVTQTKLRSQEAEQARMRTEQSLQMRVQKGQQREALIRANQAKVQLERASRSQRQVACRAVQERSIRDTVAEAKDNRRRVSEQLCLGRSEAESQKQHQVQNLRHALSSATALRIARQTEKETQAREEYR